MTVGHGAWTSGSTRCSCLESPLCPFHEWILACPCPHTRATAPRLPAPCSWPGPTVSTRRDSAEVPAPPPPDGSGQQGSVTRTPESRDRAPTLFGVSERFSRGDKSGCHFPRTRTTESVLPWAGRGRGGCWPGRSHAVSCCWAVRLDPCCQVFSLKLRQDVWAQPPGADPRPGSQCAGGRPGPGPVGSAPALGQGTARPCWWQAAQGWEGVTVGSSPCPLAPHV